MRLLAPLLALAALLALPAGALARDSNHDGLPDRWEKRHHLSLHVNQSGRDQDHDGLRNRAEYRAGTNPRDRDSDDDGVRDGDENAGTVKSFDGTTLVISLLRGGTASGTVDASTELRCPATASASRHGDDDPPGDDHGGDDRASCGRNALAAGARVHEAELGAAGVWLEVEVA
jgi:hypothetical protein